MSVGPTRKELAWLHGEIKTPPFSRHARLEAGVLLRHLQEGNSLGMPHSRPMPSVGPRCHELRIRDENRNWRIVYGIDPDVIVIAEVFPKTTEATPKSIIENVPESAGPVRRSGQGRAARITENEGELMMDGTKRKALEAAGFRLGDAADFLELTEEERRLVELRLKLAEAIRRRREQLNLSQRQVALLIQSTQSRVAKIEAASTGVSLDLMFRGLFAVGGSVEDLSAFAPTG